MVEAAQKDDSLLQWLRTVQEGLLFSTQPEPEQQRQQQQTREHSVKEARVIHEASLAVQLSCGEGMATEWPLHFAAIVGDIELIRHCVDNGLQLHKSMSPSPPLSALLCVDGFSSGCNDGRSSDWDPDMGSDVGSDDMCGLSFLDPVALAVSCGQLKSVVALVLAGATPLLAQHGGGRLLVAAARRGGHTAVARFLEEYKV